VSIAHQSATRTTVAGPRPARRPAPGRPVDAAPADTLTRRAAASLAIVPLVVASALTITLGLAALAFVAVVALSSLGA